MAKKRRLATERQEVKGENEVPPIVEPWQGVPAGGSQQRSSDLQNRLLRWLRMGEI